LFAEYIFADDCFKSDFADARNLVNIEIQETPNLLVPEYIQTFNLKEHIFH